LRIPDRHSEDLFVDVHVDGFWASVSVPLSGRWAVTRVWPRSAWWEPSQALTARWVPAPSPAWRVTT